MIRLQDLDEMLKRERPDGAIIATPNHLHLANAEVCTKFAVNMLVEKPIADSLEDAYRIIELAKDVEIQLIVGCRRCKFLWSMVRRQLVRWLSSLLHGNHRSRTHPQIYSMERR